MPNPPQTRTLAKTRTARSRYLLHAVALPMPDVSDFPRNIVAPNNARARQAGGVSGGPREALAEGVRGGTGFVFGVVRAMGVGVPGWIGMGLLCFDQLDVMEDQRGGWDGWHRSLEVKAGDY